MESGDALDQLLTVDLRDVSSEGQILRSEDGEAFVVISVNPLIVSAQSDGMKFYKCPDPYCHAGFIALMDDMIVGDVLECRECAAEVEVIAVDPVRMRLIVEEK